MEGEAGSADAEKLVPLKVYGRQREELPPAQAAVIGKMRRMIMRKISIRLAPVRLLQPEKIDTGLDGYLSMITSNYC
jgi:hypothetical protein